jgi:hypothetical protein
MIISHRILGTGNTGVSGLEVADNGISLRLSMLGEKGDVIHFMQIDYDQWEDLIKAMGYKRK